MEASVLMAKCTKCNKKGFFLKVNLNGFCKECERIISLEEQENQIKESIKALNSELSEKNKLYQEIYETAKAEALKDISTKLGEKENELNELTKKLDLGNQELENVNSEKEKSQKSINSNAKKVQKMQTLYKSMKHAVDNFSNDDIFDKNLISKDVIEEVDEILSATVQLKLHYMDVKQLRKLFNQNNKLIKETLDKYKARYTTKANIAIYKLMVIALEAELQNVLYNINFGKLDNAIKDIKTIIEKYLKIATDGNQSIAPTMKKFIGELEYLFIEAIKIEYEYYVQKERIKEEQRAIREQMKQEAEERKQLEQQRKQVEKEEEKYKNEIASITEQLSVAVDEEKAQQLQERIAQLQDQLLAVENKKEEIISRQNGKAGYVYVISNLGSFGQDVFKIGMTRRLEPQERIKELGDASVPFPFDVQSFIFSDDAVGLEQTMHKMLNNKRVNKVNLRKEFFSTSLDELEELVYSLEPSAEFNRTLLAEQYYQSLSISELPESSEIISEFVMDEDE